MVSTKDKFYKKYSAAKYTAAEKRELKKQELYTLYEAPKKDKTVEVPKNLNIEKGKIYQADLLYMPNDDGFKFVLVVVDTADGKTFAAPLKSREPPAVLVELEKCFAEMGIPKCFQVDSGTEFKGSVLKYLKENNVLVKVSKVGRSRQVAYAENRNKDIAKALFMRMSAEELLTDKPALHWVEDLPVVVSELNKRTKDLFKSKKKKVESAKTPIFTNGNKKLLYLGTKVRIILDKPREITGRKLTGNFRATDIRFSTEVYEIGNIILQDGEPPMYLVKNEKGAFIPVGYTRNQLAPIEDQEKPPPSVLRGNPERVIDQILNKKKTENRVFFLIHYKGDPLTTTSWMARTEVIKTVPELVKEFDKMLR